LESVLATQAAIYWVEVLEAAGVPCSLVQTVADAVDHPQVRARNMIIEAGGLRMAGNPIKLSAWPESATRPAAPALDADGKRIREELS
jgi:CoA:oxalate CoA-transferase